MSASRIFSRRSLLAGGAALAGAAALRPALAAAPIDAPAPAGAAPDRWESLRRIAGDGLLRPGEAEFGSAALPNNSRFRHIRPEGVVKCTSPRMVADVLSWCRDYDMPFAIRGGGHSYAGFSTSDSLVIDNMSPMHALGYDAATGQARIEAGALNLHLLPAMRRTGRIVTHGRCPTVGIAGFLLGGGIGFNMRRFGVGCDLVTSAQIVTADGRIREVSPETDADLFWALRGGGGGNFGVSTAFTIRTFPADPQITVFRIVWRSRTLDVAKALFQAAEAAPREFGSRISLGGVTPVRAQRGRTVPLTLLGQFAGGREGLMKILAPVLAVEKPEFEDIHEMTYWDGQQFLSDPGEPAWYRQRSGFLQAPPSEAMLEAAFERLYQWPGTGASGDLFFFQTGGRINDVAADATAFVHRTSRWLAVVGASWSEDDASRPAVARRAMEWQDGLYEEAIEEQGEGAFQNFPDTSMVDRRKQYYGANLDRLLEIKAEVDPTNFFHHPQSI